MLKNIFMAKSQDNDSVKDIFAVDGEIFSNIFN